MMTDKYIGLRWRWKLSMIYCINTYWCLIQQMAITIIGMRRAPTVIRSQMVISPATCPKILMILVTCYIWVNHCLLTLSILRKHCIFIRLTIRGKYARKKNEKLFYDLSQSKISIFCVCFFFLFLPMPVTR